MRGDRAREREREFLTRSCGTMPPSSLSTPDTNFTPQLPFTPRCITICMACSSLIMLITCPELCLEKMGVFSSPLRTNAAYCNPEMYIQSALKGQIFPRCWLHSGRLP